MNLLEKLGEQGIIFYQLFFIYNYMNFKNKYSLMMFITILINVFINLATKNQLMKLMKPYNHKLGFLGSFCRPLDKGCKNISMTGYGMPSGHSQVASFIPAIYYFLYKDYDDFSYPKFLTMISIGIFIMSTRYTSKVHSIQQIIVGSLYGILIAYGMGKVINYFDLS